MGIGEDEFVILMIGRIRFWREVELIQRAFDLARVPKKRLLMAGKFASERAQVAQAHAQTEMELVAKESTSCCRQGMFRRTNCRVSSIQVMWPLFRVLKDI